MTVNRVLEWWESFEFLTPLAQREFGQLVDQLERGMPTTAVSSSATQPAGWSGVARRGPWERLVPSELALAEVSQEEFLRRADQGELSFWALDQESEPVQPGVWLWLDVGPDQLGACRVVQIAVMLWMQRRCRRSGAPFYWGTIQEPQRGYEELGAEQLQAYLRARSSAPPERPPERLSKVETWCVGSRAWTSGLPAGFRPISLTQTGFDHVELRLGNTILELSMPPVALAQTLLQDPLSWGKTNSQRAGAGSRGALSQTTAFSPSGSRLLRTGNGQITVTPIPTSLKDLSGHTRVHKLASQGPVIALGVLQRRISLVQEVGSDWVFSYLNTSDLAQAHYRTVPKWSIPSATAEQKTLGSCWIREGSWELWLDNALYEVVGSELRLQFRALGGIARGAESLFANSTGVFDLAGRSRWTFPTEATGSVFLSVGQQGYVAAFPTHKKRWMVCTEENEFTTEVRGDVIGATPDGTVLIFREGNIFQHLGDIGDRFVDLGYHVSDALLGPAGTLITLTESGAVGAYDLKKKQHRREPRPL